MSSSSRRAFLRTGALGAAAGLAVACTQPAPQSAAPTAPPSAGTAAPAPAPTSAPAAAAQPQPAAAQPTVAQPQPSSAQTQPQAPAAGQRALVVLQLSGGHDGLNAVIPYGDGLYYQLRPQIGIPADKVLHLDDQIGLHPNLTSFKSLYDQGQLAILQGVGYPNPNRSHFRSMEIWHSARPDGPSPDQGWLGAFMSEMYKVGDSPFECVNFGTSVPQALRTQQAPVAALQDTTSFQFLVDRRLPSMKEPLLKTFGQVATKPARKSPATDMVARNWDATTTGVSALSAVSEKYQPKAQYPNNPLAKTLQQVAQMLSSDLGTRVVYLQLGGFDTHANEKPQHATLMTQMADSLAAFQADLDGHGLSDNVVTMLFSEFGRRVKENGSQGTDHGAAGPMFVIGKAVRGGVYGDYPKLNDLDDGDLKFGIDFRSVYATVLDGWFNASSPEVLGGNFPTLNFLAA
ncbi:MAG: DUF1501 domain-containing protein [Chloroflexi bacterium]|nr:DUF1501 domain-containing protein [Chloroflexota bacterium]MBV9896175.1 DUF1501 domain-containing protein [Chloroflexota bacterium]